jgi:hypothetical protein
MNAPIAWICLVLFVRIGAYQWVTGISNKKNLLLSSSPAAGFQEQFWSGDQA